MTVCPFCDRIAHGDITCGTGLAVTFPDAYPVNPGHMLIVSRRHEADYGSLKGRFTATCRPGPRLRRWTMPSRSSRRSAHADRVAHRGHTPTGRYGLPNCPQLVVSR